MGAFFVSSFHPNNFLSPNLERTAVKRCPFKYADRCCSTFIGDSYRTDSVRTGQTNRLQQPLPCALSVWCWWPQPPQGSRNYVNPNQIGRVRANLRDETGTETKYKKTNPPRKHRNLISCNQFRTLSGSAYLRTGGLTFPVHVLPPDWRSPKGQEEEHTAPLLRSRWKNINDQTYALVCVCPSVDCVVIGPAMRTLPCPPGSSYRVTHTHAR